MGEMYYWWISIQIHFVSCGLIITGRFKSPDLCGFCEATKVAKCLVKLCTDRFLDCNRIKQLILSQLT